MTEKYFKVTLKSDVVLNSKLATEGNMVTLDYIPGSNFLGIVAAQLYRDLGRYNLTQEDAFAVFHSGEVSFGNATISKDNELSYPVPFDYMMVKGEDKLGKHPVYLQHLLNRKNGLYPKDENGNFRQLKQKRSGYLTTTGKAITKIRKTFALKSAQDATTRRSKDAAMFGFESLQKGQEFIFSVQFKDDKYIDPVTNALKGNRRIGKSKRAQYGLVFIEEIESPKEIDSVERDHTLVYVESNLCIIDKATGQLTFRPTAEQLGLAGQIDWGKSYIRTYAYSPWNGKRNTNDALRTCIAAGSIFCIDQKNEPGRQSVGAFQAEGLGRIIVNPDFLKGNEKAECEFVKENTRLDSFAEKDNGISGTERLITSLGMFLKEKTENRKMKIVLSEAIQKELDKQKSVFNKYNISASQWGAIRNYAIRAKNMIDLERDLISNETGFLRRGVAYERYWMKNEEKPFNKLKEVFIEAKTHNENGTLFIAKFATEMAKIAPKN